LKTRRESDNQVNVLVEAGALGHGVVDGQTIDVNGDWCMI